MLCLLRIFPSLARRERVDHDPRHPRSPRCDASHRWTRRGVPGRDGRDDGGPVAHGDRLSDQSFPDRRLGRGARPLAAAGGLLQFQLYDRVHGECRGRPDTWRDLCRQHRPRLHLRPAAAPRHPQHHPAGEGVEARWHQCVIALRRPVAGRQHLHGPGTLRWPECQTGQCAVHHQTPRRPAESGLRTAGGQRRLPEHPIELPVRQQFILRQPHRHLPPEPFHLHGLSARDLGGTGALRHPLPRLDPPGRRL